MDLDTHHRQGQERVRLKALDELGLDDEAMRLRRDFERVSRKAERSLRVRRLRGKAARFALPLLIAATVIAGAGLAIITA